MLRATAVLTCYMWDIAVVFVGLQARGKGRDQSVSPTFLPSYSTASEQIMCSDPPLWVHKHCTST